MPTKILWADTFEHVIRASLMVASGDGESFVELNAGDIHRIVGGYPGPDNRMPICCAVMYRLMKQGDVVVYAPPKGKGASLTIRYAVPKQRAWRY
jgi:5-methylcytosine-specific restriction protein A